MKITLRDILQQYWPYILQHKWTTSISFFGFVSGGVIADSITPLLYKKIIDTTISGVNPQNIEILANTLLLFVGITIAYTVLFRIADFAHAYAQSKILKSLADTTFVRIGKHSQEFFSNTFVGALVAKAKRYVDAFETLHDIFVFNIGMNIIVLLTTFTILFFLSKPLVAMFIVWLVLYVIGTLYFLKRKIPKDIEHTKTQSITTGRLADAVSNILTIKMFARLKTEIQSFDHTTKLQEQARMKTWRWDNWQRVFQAISVSTLNILVLVGAVILWIRGDITAGTIVLVQVYLFSLSEIVWNLGRQIARVVGALNNAREMIEIFQTTVSVADIAAPEKIRMSKGTIEFGDVSFTYQGSRKVFEHLSLDIPAGQKVGLVGHSGAGKTTITKLLLRFVDIDSGSITIDGQDIRKVTQDDLRSVISYVPQDPILFHRSLYENIAYGKIGASREEVIDAAKKARAHEFIIKLDDGYDTLVGERGVKLSGGERQRVAIARAMLKDAPILILDEATSSLDSISERHIQDALTELIRGKTTLVVAHRLSTIAHMDRILVFEDGKIVEDDTHGTLIENTEGIYQELWKEQSSGFAHA